MYSSASSAAAASTTSSSEPERKTRACSTASRSGWTFSSGGMRGKTAAPSGTSAGRSGSVMSASGHSGNDGQFVAVLDRGVEIVEVAHVLVVEVEVDEAAHLAVVEDAAADAGILRAERVEHALDRGGGDFDG